MLKTYGAAPYAAELKKLEKEIKDKQTTINEKIGTLYDTYRMVMSSRYRRRQGVRHRISTTTSMGHRSGQAANARRATTASREMYKDHT